MTAHIFCIDDDLSILKMFERYLCSKGYRISAFAKGIAARDAFFELQPDLILLDLKLVDVEGAELLRYFATESPETPVVVVSGLGEMSIVLNSLRSGAWDFIVKPLESLGILAHVVENMLDKAKLLKENRLYRENLEEKVKQRTQELENLNQKLLHEIEERVRIAEERVVLMQELSHKKEELEGFVYAVSHDLRSPLVNIHGFSNEIAYFLDSLNSLLAMPTEGNIQKIKQIIDEELAVALRYILSSTQKMDQLIKGLIKMARLGLEPCFFHHIDMNVLLSDVIKCKSFQIKEQQAKIIADDLLPCFGSLPHINQVFSNLIENSLKYATQERLMRIQVSSYLENNMVVYRVTDNGIGISADDCEKIFDWFYRAESANQPVTNKNEVSEGIGLSIVSKILRRHGGSVRACPNPDGGVSFWVSIPHQE